MRAILRSPLSALRSPLSALRSPLSALRSPHSRTSEISGYDVVRIALGILLLTAAALKGHQLATEPVAETSLFTSRWFLIIVVEFELVFGLWLLVGVHPRRTWLAALLCFGGFACVSLFKAVSGEASCGCFGNVVVNPWYTLVLDLGAVVALLSWRPIQDESAVSAGAVFLRRRTLGVATVSLLVGIPAAFAKGSYQAGTLGNVGEILGDGRTVVLKPREWIGKSLPLLKYTELGERLAEGNWIVLLYHHDCPTCARAILWYERLANEAAGLRVALLELPPYREAVSSVDSPAVHGSLVDDREWFVATPVQISLRRGRVMAVLGARQVRSLLTRPPQCELNPSRPAEGCGIGEPEALSVGLANDRSGAEGCD